KACVLPENPASYRVVRKKSYLFNKAHLLIKIAVIRTFPAKILRFTDSLTVTDPVIPLVLR
ncbi:hypothetical protein ABN128_27945, partial [Klebsiella variicola subsp. variicola]